MIAAETDDAPTKLELRPQMGLAEATDDLPRLQVTVKNRKGELISNVHARLTALVIRPDNHDIIYLECVAMASAVAHAIMAACVEQDSTKQTWAFCPSPKHGYEIQPQNDMRVADAKLALKGYSSGLHHFAMMSQDDDFIIADTDEQLWRKLRKKMSCPTKEEWGAVLLPRVRASGALIGCESFGLPDGMSVYVLELDAEQTFDALVCKHVKENGL